MNKCSAGVVGGDCLVHSFQELGECAVAFVELSGSRVHVVADSRDLKCHSEPVVCGESNKLWTFFVGDRRERLEESKSAALVGVTIVVFVAVARILVANIGCNDCRNSSGNDYFHHSCGGCRTLASGVSTGGVVTAAGAAFSGSDVADVISVAVMVAVISVAVIVTAASAVGVAAIAAVVVVIFAAGSDSHGCSDRSGNGEVHQRRGGSSNCGNGVARCLSVNGIALGGRAVGAGAGAGGGGSRDVAAKVVDIVGFGGHDIFEIPIVAAAVDSVGAAESAAAQAIAATDVGAGGAITTVVVVAAVATTTTTTTTTAAAAAGGAAATAATTTAAAAGGAAATAASTTTTAAAAWRCSLEVARD